MKQQAPQRQNAGITYAPIIINVIVIVLLAVSHHLGKITEGKFYISITVFSCLALRFVHTILYFVEQKSKRGSNSHNSLPFSYIALLLHLLLTALWFIIGIDECTTKYYGSWYGPPYYYEDDDCSILASAMLTISTILSFVSTVVQTRNHFVMKGRNQPLAAQGYNLGQASEFDNQKSPYAISPSSENQGESSDPDYVYGKTNEERFSGSLYGPYN